MINITPRTPPELVGCRNFGFRADQRLTESQDLEFGSQAEKLNQHHAVERVAAAVQTLKNYPCESNLTIGVQDGRVVMDGSLTPYESKAMEAVQTILPQINQLLSRFHEHYEGSSFTITATQTVTITSVHAKE